MPEGPEIRRAADKLEAAIKGETLNQRLVRLSSVRNPIKLS